MLLQVSSLALPYIPTCYANKRNQALVKNKERRKKIAKEKVAAAVVLTEIK
jgi:hypothetical protein